MKKWMMPRVGIELFRANEYIAACAEFADTSSLTSGSTYYINIYDGGNNRYATAASPDSKCQTQYETFVYGGSSSGTVNSSAPTHWYYGKSRVYSAKTNSPNGQDYGNSSYFRYLTYAVWIYVLNGTAYLYDGTINNISKQFTPTADKLYSS